MDQRLRRPGHVGMGKQRGEDRTWSLDVFPRPRPVTPTPARAPHRTSSPAAQSCIGAEPPRLRRVGRHRRYRSAVAGYAARLYDDQLRIAAELDGTNAVAAVFVYATGANVPELVVRGATTYRIITDSIGSPRLVVDVSSGTIAQEMRYDAFGNVLVDTAPGFTPFGFAGGLYD